MARPRTALFPMSRLAVSVTNFKGLEADGKAKATRVDQYFKKQAEGSEGFEQPAGLDRLFPALKKDQPIELKKTELKKSASSTSPSVSVFDMLIASAKPKQTPHTDCTDLTESPKHETLKLPQQSPKHKKIKPSKQNISPTGILKFFKPPPSSSADISSFTCKECNFVCELESERDIQEHLDFHLALKLSRE